MARRLLENARGKVHEKKSTPLKKRGGGVIEANYKGRITGSWATNHVSFGFLASERASHPRRSRALCTSTHW